ncbi:NAD(+) kinase [Erysiphe necator]|uniref:Putative nad+ kinase utr1 n=1 Tax=Uncinula necator TaxID=52586 RepID=A0A0B1P5W3_UNCNE|nr:NAD(+) kinase [Erysiphe necator]KHJ32074.1 putative nad+ kinase utr1 [Erysiphe necator]
MVELRCVAVTDSDNEIDLQENASEISRNGVSMRYDANLMCSSQARSADRFPLASPESKTQQFLSSPQFPEPIVTSPINAAYFDCNPSIASDICSKARNRKNNHQNLTLHHSVTEEKSSKSLLKETSPSYQGFNAAIQEKKSKSLTPMNSGLFTSLDSPCFFHQRFDDVLNFDKLIEAIRDNEALSHSRLMATATGVREISKQLQRRPFKRAIKNVMIVTKARDNELVTLTKELALWLMKTPRYGSDLGVNVYVDAKLERSKRFGAAEILESDTRLKPLLRYWKPEICRNRPEIFDLVITLGGDGTVLFTSWLFQRVVPPILSFSLGSLGFLTNFEFDKFQSQLNKVMDEEGMRVSMRMRFTCTVHKADTAIENKEPESYEVLNEVVIDRGPSPYVSNLELYGEDELLTVVQADGCIFATPTGSTAYSLSAGGSLVHPDIPGILLTPICPHTLSFRPLILSDTLLLRVAIPPNSRATAYCAFDGKARVELRQGDSITIAASQYPFPTVMKSGSEWFNSVSNSLKWNTRGATQKGWVGSEKEKNDESAWDIDFDDSAYGTSEENSVLGSP